MDDELDALFELFDEDDGPEDGEQCVKVHGGSTASAEGAQPVPEADQAEDDMLLFLAEECAADNQQKPSPHASSRQVGSSSTTAHSASAANTAAAQLPALKLRGSNNDRTAPAAAARMPQSRAFGIVNASKPATNGLMSSSSASRATSQGLGGTSGAQNSSKTGKQQMSNECQHFVEKLTKLKVITGLGQAVKPYAVRGPYCYCIVGLFHTHHLAESGSIWIYACL